MDSQNTPTQQNQNFTAVARMAYDNDGHLDANRVQLLTQGLFLSQEEAATLPHHITMDNDDDQERSPRPGRRVVAPQANTTREQSDRGNWNEEEVELLIRLHAERVSFAEITKHFPGKSQKACQEKYYHTVKDSKDTSWAEFHDGIRKEHDEKRKPK